MLGQRFPQYTENQLMQIAGIAHEELRHTRAAQEWLAEGEAREAAKMTVRLLNRRCGPLNESTTAQIQALPVDQLEAPATWLAANA